MPCERAMLHGVPNSVGIHLFPHFSRNVGRGLRLFHAGCLWWYDFSDGDGSRAIANPQSYRQASLTDHSLLGYPTRRSRSGRLPWERYFSDFPDESFFFCWVSDGRLTDTTGAALVLLSPEHDVPS